MYTLQDTIPQGAKAHVSLNGSTDTSAGAGAGAGASDPPPSTSSAPQPVNGKRAVALEAAQQALGITEFLPERRGQVARFMLEAAEALSSLNDLSSAEAWAAAAIPAASGMEDGHHLTEALLHTCCVAAVRRLDFRAAGSYLAHFQRLPGADASVQCAALALQVAAANIEGHADGEAVN